jgi:Undecaprenyl-phosphate galactose phosphotransferase WbaP
MLRCEDLQLHESEQREAQRETIRLRRATATQIGLLVLCDLYALTLAALIAYWLWAHRVLHQPSAVYFHLAPLLVLFPISYTVGLLYPGFGLGAVETLRRLVDCTNVSCLFIAAASFAFQDDPLYSRMTFGIFWMCALFAVPMERFLMLSVVSHLAWWGEPAIIFGRPNEAGFVIRLLRGAFSLGYRVVGVVTNELTPYNNIDGVPILGGVEALPQLTRMGVSTCLVWDRSDDFGLLLGPAYERYFRHVVLLRDWKSLPIEQVRLRNLGGVLGIDLPGNLLNRRNQAIKRAIDLVAGSILSLIALPIIVIFGVLIKLISPGPMFFVQQREGVGGSKLRIWKLRTMHPQAEERLMAYLKDNPDLQREWQRSVKLVNDPRIIPVIGSLMRRFSIDELPQLCSVVTGAMSLVGPRPFPEYHLSRFDGNFRDLRRAVRPGLTGMWQVMVRSRGNLEQQEMYDTYYIRNWSLWLDIYLLGRTVFALITGRGAA